MKLSWPNRQRRFFESPHKLEWHDWFAWRPVKVGNNDYRWLETVSRYGISNMRWGLLGPYKSDPTKRRWIWYYREITNRPYRLNAFELMIFNIKQFFSRG